MKQKPINLLCDVEVDGVNRQAWVGEYMPSMLEAIPPDTLRDLIEADLRTNFKMPTLKLI